MQKDKCSCSKKSSCVRCSCVKAGLICTSQCSCYERSCCNRGGKRKKVANKRVANVESGSDEDVIEEVDEEEVEEIDEEMQKKQVIIGENDEMLSDEDISLIYHTSKKQKISKSDKVKSPMQSKLPKTPTPKKTPKKKSINTEKEQSPNTPQSSNIQNNNPSSNSQTKEKQLKYKSYSPQYFEQRMQNNGKHKGIPFTAFSIPNNNDDNSNCSIDNNNINNNNNNSKSTKSTKRAHLKGTNNGSEMIFDLAEIDHQPWAPMNQHFRNDATKVFSVSEVKDMVLQWRQLKRSQKMFRTSIINIFQDQTSQKKFQTLIDNIINKSEEKERKIIISPIDKNRSWRYVDDVGDSFRCPVCRDIYVDSIFCPLCGNSCCLLCFKPIYVVEQFQPSSTTSSTDISATTEHNLNCNQQDDSKSGLEEVETTPQAFDDVNTKPDDNILITTSTDVDCNNNNNDGSGEIASTTNIPEMNTVTSNSGDIEVKMETVSDSDCNNSPQEENHNDNYNQHDLITEETTDSSSNIHNQPHSTNIANSSPATIEGSKNYLKKCQVCDGTFTNVVANVALNNITSSLRVYCDNYEYGCEWTGPRNVLHNHLENCEYHLYECSFGCPLGSPLLIKDKHLHENICDFQRKQCECGKVVYCFEYQAHRTSDNCPFNERFYKQIIDHTSPDSIRDDATPLPGSDIQKPFTQSVRGKKMSNTTTNHHNQRQQNNNNMKSVFVPPPSSSSRIEDTNLDIIHLVTQNIDQEYRKYQEGIGGGGINGLMEEFQFRSYLLSKYEELCPSLLDIKDSIYGSYCIGNVYNEIEKIRDRKHRVANSHSYYSALKFKHAFGEKGNLDGQFFHPNSVAFNPLNDQIVVSDRLNRVQIFDANFKFVSKLESSNAEEMSFKLPRVAINRSSSTGLICINDISNHIQIFDPRTRSLVSHFHFMEQRSSSDYSTSPVIPSPTNRLNSKRSLSPISSLSMGSGSVLANTGGSIETTTPIYINSKGEVLIVLKSKRVYHFDINGRFINKISLNFPADTKQNVQFCDMEYNSRNKFLFSDRTSTRIYSFDMNGELEYIYSQPLPPPISPNRSVTSIFPSSPSSSPMPTPSTPPTPQNNNSLRGIAVDLLDNIIASEYSACKFSIRDIGGNAIQSIGGKGSNPGEFKGVFDVDVNVNNNIVVADYYNHRLQYFA